MAVQTTAMGRLLSSMQSKRVTASTRTDVHDCLDSASGLLRLHGYLSTDSAELSHHPTDTLAPPNTDLTANVSKAICFGLPFGCITGYIRGFTEESTMAKEQRNEKMTKKPKKSSAPAQDTSGTSSRPMAPVTSVLPKGKMKDK